MTASSRAPEIPDGVERQIGKYVICRLLIVAMPKLGIYPVAARGCQHENDSKALSITPFSRIPVLVLAEEIAGAILKKE